MYNMPDSLKRKKHHKQIMKLIRSINKNLETDDLWQGRFVINLICENYYIWEDMSGGYMIIEYEIADKKTGAAKLYHETESCFLDSHIYDKLNRFIIEDVDVWRKEKPYDEAQDYTHIKITPWSIKRWRQELFPYHTVVYRKEGDDLLQKEECSLNES